MSDDSSKSQYGAGQTSAIYRIVVKGHLSSRWSERLAGLTITAGESGGADEVTTVLQGCLRDRSELTGVIITLSEMRLSLLSLKLLKSDHCE